MAVPASGEISLGSIYFEFDQNDYTSFEICDRLLKEIQIEDFDEDGVSLSNLSQGIGFAGGLNTANAASDRPDGSAPHAMSEFYSYDHDLSGWSSVFNGIYAFSVVEGGTTDTSVF